jgi:hypothetical protein
MKISLFPVGGEPTEQQAAELAPLIDSAAQFARPNAPFLALFAKAQNVSKVAVATSEEEVQGDISIQDAIKIAKSMGCDTVVFDLEGWQLTPNDEKSNPSAFINRAADEVHKASLHYGIAPTYRILESIRNSVDFSKIDFVVIQLQNVTSNVQNDPTWFNICKDIVTAAAAKNPAIRISPQFRPNPTAYQANALIEQRMIQLKQSFPKVNFGLSLLYEPAQHAYVMQLLRVIKKQVA